ncbi:Uncharacterized protein Adt_21753 [Abeliophyllum distichum]|uniref:Uncharacterized protein n=1 Tax=Abeliophyllum distichum TaxID=126358 RepID=A0ABD1T0A2_9LAMI
MIRASVLTEKPMWIVFPHDPTRLSHRLHTNDATSQFSFDSRYRKISTINSSDKTAFSTTNYSILGRVTREKEMTMSSSYIRTRLVSQSISVYIVHRMCVDSIRI